MKNVFQESTTKNLIFRIENLDCNSQPLWGKMNVAQMLAHCNITYELTYDPLLPKPSGFKRFILKTFIKNAVVGPKSYKKNSPTAPVFIVSKEKDFNSEKERLIDYILKTQELGQDYFHNKENYSFGELTCDQWSTLFYKHLDHHLKQFNV